MTKQTECNMSTLRMVMLVQLQNERNVGKMKADSLGSSISHDEAHQAFPVMSLIVQGLVRLQDKTSRSQDHL